MLENKGQKTN